MSQSLKPAKYQGEGFSVTWDKETCQHAGVCVKSLPQVFGPKKKPWVNTSGATKTEIEAIIKACPSAALQFFEE